MRVMATLSFQRLGMWCQVGPGVISSCLPGPACAADGVQGLSWCSSCPSQQLVGANTGTPLHTRLGGYSRIIVPHNLSTDGTVNHN